MRRIYISLLAVLSSAAVAFGADSRIGSIAFADKELVEAYKHITVLQKQIFDKDKAAADSEAASTKEIEGLKQAVANLTGAAEEKTKKHKAEVAGLNRKITELKAASGESVRKHSAEVSELNRKIADLNSVMEENEQKHKAEIASLDKKIADLVAAADEKERQHKAETADLKKKTADFVNTSDELAMKQKAEITSLTKKIAELGDSAKEKDGRLATSNDEIARLSKEIEGLNKVVAAKNAAIDKVVGAIQAQSARDNVVGGDVFSEPQLGLVTVKHSKSGETSVLIGAKAEQAADLRFAGAIREKRRLSGDNILYVLETMKLSLAKNKKQGV